MPRGENLRRIPREIRAARLGQKALAPGEGSELVRIRAKEEVLSAFKALSPEERGRLVEGALTLRVLKGVSPQEIPKLLEMGRRAQRLPKWLVSILTFFWRPY